MLVYIFAMHERSRIIVMQIIDTGLSIEIINFGGVGAGNELA